MMIKKIAFIESCSYILKCIYSFICFTMMFLAFQNLKLYSVLAMALEPSSSELCMYKIPGNH